MKKVFLFIILALIFSNLLDAAFASVNDFILIVPVDGLLQDGVLPVGNLKKKPNVNKSIRNNNNYLDYVLSSDGRAIKWPYFPIKVYIEPKRQKNIALQAFLKWQSCSNNLVSFVFVESPQDAQITVNFFDRLESTSTQQAFISGYSKPYYVNNSISKSDIYILTLNPRTKTEMSDDFILFSLLHEIGHSLGFRGHSPNPDDIMTLQTTRILTNITARDINTLKLFYKADYKTLSSSSQRAFNIKLTQAMDYANMHPEKSTSWANLGDIYRDKGLYREAIINYNKAICIEPQKAEYYNLVGMTYYNVGDYRNAFLNLKTAVDYEPSNSFYLYQFALVCYRIGQAQTGIAYLNEFLRQNPQSNSDDKIQSLLKLYNSSTQQNVMPVIIR